MTFCQHFSSFFSYVIFRIVAVCWFSIFFLFCLSNFVDPFHWFKLFSLMLDLVDGRCVGVEMLFLQRDNVHCLLWICISVVPGAEKAEISPPKWSLQTTFFSLFYNIIKKCISLYVLSLIHICTNMGFQLMIFGRDQ